MRRACLIILDSLGMGGAPDAAYFGDAGADTLGHIAQACAEGLADSGRRGPLRLPHLTRLGLGLAANLASGRVPPGLESPGPGTGNYGTAMPSGPGKDTISGHWALAGAPAREDWGVFPALTNSMPAALVNELLTRTQLPGVLGNRHASGTSILAELGEEHLRTGRPILYTSADSVVQIAAHEEHFGLDRLLAVCRTARSIVDAYRVARVIARPFVGRDALSFTRTDNRRDFSMPPPERTLLDRLYASGGHVTAVGKIADIFAHRGIHRTIKASGIAALMDATLTAWRATPDKGLVITNFADFDSVYGHRRDVAGYARALEQFDTLLPELLDGMGPGDVCLLTADHGCDPTWRGTDHTREGVPILVHGPDIPPGCIGVRDMADVGASLAAFLGIPPTERGRTFFPTMNRRED